MNPSVPIAIRAGQLIDGVSPHALSDVVILIEEDRISRVGGCRVPPTGAQLIDLTAYNVLPGLIDCHTHMCFAPGDRKNPVLTKSIPFRALQGAAAARAILHAGFTTVLQDVRFVMIAGTIIKQPGGCAGSLSSVSVTKSRA